MALAIGGLGAGGLVMIVVVVLMGIHLGHTAQGLEQRQSADRKGQPDGAGTHEPAGISWFLDCSLQWLESQAVGDSGQKIGEVAERSGLPVKTIRFYSDEQLITPVARSDGGYRLFDDTVYGELALIRTLRAMEIPLSSIRAILQARRSGVCTCSELQNTIRTKTADIEERIADLQALRQELTDLLERWESCGGVRTPTASP